MSEIVKAAVFFVITMTICFGYILHKNQYQMHWNTQLVDFTTVGQIK